ncbi:MAG: TonB-dependent receptor [Halieaceae bacterium]|nr:TonB-dependent receptor [Halieaceae bacterium]
MNTTYFSLSALAAAVAVASPVSAQQTLEEVVVTSSRVEMPLRLVGTSVSVITEETIQDYGFNALADVLRTQPSVAVSNSGGQGSVTTVRIRGEEGFRTRTYIDGIDVSDASGIQIGPRFEHILSSGIGRVEILRGPQGLMYGADAGGIVNIFTTTNTDGLGGSVSAEGGRYGTQQYTGAVAGGNELGDFSLSAADYSTDGFNARTDDTVTRDDDGYDNTTVHARAGWNVSEGFRLEGVYRDVDADGEYDNCFTASFSRSEDCDSQFDQSAWRVSAKIDSEILTHSLSYNFSDTERAFFTEGQPGFATEGELQRIEYLANYKISDNWAAIAGIELLSEELDDGSVKRSRDQDGYYAELQGQVTKGLYLTGGLRYDDNEDFGSYTTYRASAAYLIPLQGSELKLKTTYGTGFRAPSLSELAYNEGPFAFPPATDNALEEEESKGFDIGVAWATDGGLYLEAVYFDQRVDNEIFFDQVGFSGYLQGDGEIDSSGVELITEWQIAEALTLTGNYTYNDTEDSTNDTRIRRPEHLANIGLQWNPLAERLRLGLYIRGAYDAVDVDGSSLDDYEVVNLSASYEVLQGLELYGRIENLLDEDYEETPGFNTPGAAAYAGVRYQF